MWQYTWTQDVQPNNSHYMNSITHVYSPAWLSMGAVKQSLISQCVRSVNDQCWGPSGCSSLSMATTRPVENVILMLTLYGRCPSKPGSHSILNYHSADFFSFLLQAYQLCDVSVELVEPFHLPQHIIHRQSLFSQESVTLTTFQGYSSASDLASEGK